MYDFTMNLLDVLENNIEYNKTHSDNKRVESILRHFRIYGKRSKIITLTDVPEDIKNFYINETPKIAGDYNNVKICFLSDKLSEFNEDNISYINGMKLTDIIESINSGTINQDRPYNSLSELKYKVDELGNAISIYMKSNNRSKLQDADRIINNFNKGDINEFYIVMFPEINDENIDSIKTSKDGKRIIYPDNNTIYSDAQKNYLKDKIENKVISNE